MAPKYSCRFVLVLSAALLLCTWCGVVQAHNGSVAMAVPVAGIVIDGDFADWPEGMRYYPIARFGYGDAFLGEDDLRAGFRLGYEDGTGKLYLAVEVEDDEITLEPESRDQDGCEVYLDWVHGDRESPARMYSVIGERRQMRNESGRLLPWEGVELGVSRTGNTIRYEWGIEIRGVAGEAVQLDPGKSLGLDVVVRDQDGPRWRTWVFWGAGTRKRKLPERRGDVVLLPAKGETGRLQGQLHGEEMGHPPKIRSLISEVLWVRPGVDPDGGYSVELPTGEYAIEVLGEKVRVEVRENSVSEVVLSLLQRHEGSEDTGGAREQNAGPGTRRQEWHMLGIPDGLPSLSVRDMVQDQNGRLWLATGSGVVRFDGSRFTTFTTADGLAHDDVRAVLFDREGDLWLATRGGVSRFDGERFTTFTEADGLASNEVRALFQDTEGNLLLGTAGGVSQFNRKMFSRFELEDGLSDGHLLDWFQDRDGTIWMARSGGLSRFDGEQWEILDEEKGFPDQRVNAIYQDSTGAIWFGGEGVIRYDGLDFAVVAGKDLLKENDIGEIWRIFAGKDGHLWFAWQGGICRIDGGHLVHFPFDQNLHDWWGESESIGVDRAGNEWLLDGDLKIVRFDGREYATLDEVTGLSLGECRIVFADREGDLWFGTDRGAVRWDGKNWERFTTDDGLAGNKIQGILQDRKGDLWFTFYMSGTSRFDGREFTSFAKQDGLPSNAVSDVFRDSRGDVWISTFRGVSRYRGGQLTTFTAREGLLHYAPAVREDREGNLWFDTTFYNGRVFRRYGAEQGFADDHDGLKVIQDEDGFLWFHRRWDGGDVYRYNGAQFVDFAPAAALQDVRANAFWQEVGGVLWVGSDRGACRRDGEEMDCLNEGDGLPHGRVQTLVQDNRGRLWIGTEGGLVRRDGDKFIHIDELAGQSVQALFPGSGEEMWIGADGGLFRYDGARLVAVAPKDEPGGSAVQSIFQDREENLWVGTQGSGISRFDGGQFATFAAEGRERSEVLNGLVDSREHLWFATAQGSVLHHDGVRLSNQEIGEDILCMAEGDSGSVWLGTRDGVNRLEGNDIRRWTRADGLADDQVRAVYQDRGGILWFGTARGVSRYDGEQFANFTAADGLADDAVRVIRQDRDGNLWFGAESGGISRFDGERFENFQLGYYTVSQGLVHAGVRDIFQDSRGRMWFATAGGGVSRYDSTGLTTFTTADGLAHDVVTGMLEDDRGRMWSATAGGGVSRYDSTGLVTLTTADGLAHDEVTCIARDREGHLWFGTRGGGVSQYDGLVFQNLLQRDGLAHDVVSAIVPDSRGDIWFATRGGITRYRPQRTPPRVSIVDVNRQGAISEISMPSSREFLSIALEGISFKTRPEQMAFAYRLEGLEQDWNYTYKGQVEYTNLPVGEYVFSAKVVDRDLNYSPEVRVQVTVHPPYAQMGIAGGLGLALVGLIVVSGYALRRRRELRQAQRALIEGLEKELQTAHEMQMALMPKEQPSIEGLDIAGRCQPATHVGGDIFQYFDHRAGRMAVSLADVTGHAMEAAVPVMVFSGILKTEMQYDRRMEDLFVSLNRSLHGTLEKRTFICLVMGEIDISSGFLRMANSGCPYPFHYRAAAGKVVEVELNAYPLGINPDSIYPVAEVQLERGDYVVFCSDGIVEADNPEKELFGFGQLAETIGLGCQQGLSAEGLIEQIFAVVQNFAGEAPQGDDQTVVVVRRAG